mmetsp:Transcript_45101/g.78039  ORF Transcript_45101/g.78039 Transcript_45101/m.78039 type:complete len:250 (+) Transcript_45101:232-981(+)
MYINVKLVRKRLKMPITPVKCSELGKKVLAQSRGRIRSSDPQTRSTLCATCPEWMLMSGHLKSFEDGSTGAATCGPPPTCGPRTRWPAPPTGCPTSPWPPPAPSPRRPRSAATVPTTATAPPPRAAPGAAAPAAAPAPPPLPGGWPRAGPSRSCRAPPRGRACRHGGHTGSTTKGTCEHRKRPRRPRCGTGRGSWAPRPTATPWAPSPRPGRSMMQQLTRHIVHAPNCRRVRKPCYRGRGCRGTLRTST